MKPWNVVLFFALAGLVGCTDAEWSAVKSLGSRYRVTVYSGTAAVRSYTSTGRVAWDHSGGGCDFEDAATKKHVRVSGTIVAEELGE